MICSILALLLLLVQEGGIDKAGELFDEGRYSEAASTIEKLLPELRSSDDPETLADCLSMLAVSYNRIGAFNLALEAQQECYELDLKSGDIANISSSLNNLAGTYLSLENYDEAERLIREAISYEEQLGQTPALAVRYGMASDILLKKEKIDEAIAFAQKALKIDDEAGRTVQAAIRKSQLAEGYIEAGRMEEAEKLLTEAVPIFQATNNLHSLSVCKHQLGIIQAKRGDFNASAHSLREALTLSRQTGNLLLQKKLSEDLGVVLKDSDPRSAIGYLQDAVALTDSIYSQENARRKDELMISSEVREKEQELERQQNEIKKRRLLMVLLSVAVLLLVTLLAVSLRALRMRSKNEQMLRKAGDIKDKLLLLGKEVPNGADNENIASMLDELKNLGADTPDKTLTLREQEIVRLCCKGLQNKEIADRLNISTRTVETHKNNIFRKLEINSTAELIALIEKRQNL